MPENFSWSYSAYSSAVRCLRHFNLCYVDKITPLGISSGDMAFGSALHSGINAVLSGEDYEISFIVYWDTYKEKELAYSRFRWPELRELGLNFLRKFAKYHAPKYKIEMAEKRLYGNYKGLRLEGTPDFVGSYSGQPSLRDYKSSGYNYAGAKRDLALQLHLYSFLAISECAFTPQSLGYTVFNKGTGSIQDLTWDFSETKMYAMLDDMLDYCEMVDKQKTYPKNPNSCLIGKNTCEYFENCWGKDATS